MDGKEVARKAIPHTIPFIATVDETFDVGVDTRMGVDDNDYQPPFRFTDTLEKLTIKLVPPKRTAEEEQLLRRRRRTPKRRRSRSIRGESSRVAALPSWMSLRCGVGSAPSSTRCGATYAAKLIHAGYGMRLTTTVALC